MTREAILAAAWEVAREHGLAALTLRQVAERVGMRAPSLYSHFDSKHAIYDAMFGQAWTSYEELVRATDVTGAPRAVLRLFARRFFDFSVGDLARYQLMNLRMIPDFTPSAESYAPAVRVLAGLRTRLATIGLAEDADIDLFTAVTSGMVSQQWANDPGGTRWARLLDRAMDMYADAVGLPKEDTP